MRCLVSNRKYLINCQFLSWLFVSLIDYCLTSNEQFTTRASY